MSEPEVAYTSENVTWKEEAQSNWRLYEQVVRERDSLKRDLHICAFVLMVESVLVIVLAVS